VRTFPGTHDPPLSLTSTASPVEGNLSSLLRGAGRGSIVLSQLWEFFMNYYSEEDDDEEELDPLIIP